MGFLDNLMGRNQSVGAHVIAPSVVGAGVNGEKDAEKSNVPMGAAAASSDSFASRDASTPSLEERNEREVDEHGNTVTATAELGVKKAEAVALVWSQKAVYLTYLWIWVCFFMLALQQSILSNVMYYAYSDFASAPQISTAYILAYVVGGVLKLPIAKVLNIWGRAEGFFVFEAVYLLGIVIIAACNGPNSYAAGYVIYWIGYDALYFIMDVFIADTSGLRNRAFAFAFVSTPFICTAFTGPLAAQSFLDMTTWRWAAGAFAIIMFFVFTPLGIIFKFFQHKAEKQGLFTRPDTGRSVWQSIHFYFHDFDIVGACLLIIAWVLFLLPFSMVSNGVAGYHEAKFIAMVVIGIVFFFVFAAWERFLARTHFIRWELFRSRTVVGASIMSAVIYYSFYSWDLYYYYFIRVVYNLSISKTGYMTQIYNVGSCFFGPIFGLWVRYTKHFKYACLFFGLPLMMLGAGLMIRFRGQDSNIGFIIMCQIFIAFAGGTLTIGTSMAYMTAADRNGVPLMLAMQYLFTSLGGAIGTAVCGSIYQSTFREALRQRLPAESQGDIETIINGGYLVQLEYPVGNATRDAINYAWGYSQKYNSISSTAILALGIVGIMLWKNYNVDKKQNKGTLI